MDEELKQTKLECTETMEDTTKVPAGGVGVSKADIQARESVNAAADVCESPPLANTGTPLTSTEADKMEEKIDVPADDHASKPEIQARMLANAAANIGALSPLSDRVAPSATTASIVPSSTDLSVLSADQHTMIHPETSTAPTPEDTAASIMVSGSEPSPLATAVPCAEQTFSGLSDPQFIRAFDRGRSVEDMGRTLENICRLAQISLPPAAKMLSFKPLDETAVHPDLRLPRAFDEVKGVEDMGKRLENVQMLGQMSSTSTTRLSSVPFKQTAGGQPDPRLFRAFDGVKAVEDMGKRLENIRIMAQLTPANQQFCVVERDLMYETIFEWVEFPSGNRYGQTRRRWCLPGRNHWESDGDSATPQLEVPACVLPPTKSTRVKGQDQIESMPATMSERRSYNFRPRKEVSYSEDQQQKDEVLDNEMPKRKGKAKKKTTPKKSAKARPSKASKRKTPIEDESKNRVSFYSSGESSDELKSPNKDQNQSKYHDEELHNTYTPTETHSDRHPLSTNNVSFAGVRKRLHGESTLDRTHLDQPDLERSELPEGEVYSGDDEPDSTMPDFEHGFEPNFGTISPIKDEYTSKEKRDKLTSGVGRELRPIPKRKRHQSKEEVMEAFQKSVKRQILVSVLGLVIISALAVAAILTFEDVKSSVPSTRRSRLKSNLEKLKVQFPSQSDRLWNVLGGASLSHIMDPPILERPVVVLLAGTSESVTTLRCLATKVAAMFDDVFQSSRNPIVIKGNTYIEMNSDQAKMKIDQDLKTGFEAHSRSAIVHNLDYLPPCSILLFHSYCENDNAPYKDVAIILTVQLGIEDVDLEDMKSREFDQAVGDHLKIRWDDCPQELTPDKQDAMLSRVGNNIARVKSEDRIVVREVCY